MAREFSVKFLMRAFEGAIGDLIEQKMEVSDLLDFDLLVTCEVYPDRNRIYVAEESLPIFKHKMDDFVSYQIPGNLPAVMRVNDPLTPWNKFVENIQIITRDNKLFFMPEVGSDL